MRWNVGQTVTRIKRQSNVDVDVIDLVASSLVKKFRLVTYHRMQAEECLYKDFSDGDFKAVHLSSSYLGAFATFTNTPQETIVKAHSNVFECEAHIEAFAHQLHSIADNIAMFIYLAFPDLREVIPRKSQVTLFRLSDMVSDPLSAELKSLFEMKEYKYLSAYVNQSKHQSLVKRNFSCKFDVSFEEHPNQIQFDQFEYKGSFYPQLEAFRFTKEYGSIILRKYILIGLSICELLENGHSCQH